MACLSIFKVQFVSNAPWRIAEANPERRQVKRILFVCTANVCRSPMAAAIFDALTEDRDLPFQAGSAGIAALEGKPMTPNAITALEEVGIYPEAHRARQVDEKALAESELVLAMSPWHIAEIRRLFGHLTLNVHTLPEYATGIPDEEGIPDPYGQTMAAYRSSMRQLYDYIGQVVACIER
jgi:protein arginine phosphatase